MACSRLMTVNKWLRLNLNVMEWGRTKKLVEVSGVGPTYSVVLKYFTLPTGVLLRLNVSIFAPKSTL